jgi:hypothetical protein
MVFLGGSPMCASGLKVSAAGRTFARGRVGKKALPWVHSALLGLGLTAAIVPPARAASVYVPLAPCRLVNTSVAGGAFADGETRLFRVFAPTTSYAAQGGNPNGCGVPAFVTNKGGVQALMLNFVAVNPTGPGNLKAYAGDAGGQPAASTLNFQQLAPNLNLANGIAIPVRITGVAADSNDLAVTASLFAAGATVQVVVDVVGYFAELSTASFSDIPCYRGAEGDDPPFPGFPGQKSFLTYDGAGRSALVCLSQQLEAATPNDTPGTALFPDLNAAVIGFLDGSTDTADYFQATLEARGLLVAQTIDLPGVSACATADTELTLYANDGTTVLATDDDSGRGLCAKLSAVLDAGSYYVKVSSAMALTYQLAIATP